MRNLSQNQLTKNDLKSYFLHVKKLHIFKFLVEWWDKFIENVKNSNCGSPFLVYFTLFAYLVTSECLRRKLSLSHPVLLLSLSPFTFYDRLCYYLKKYRTPIFFFVPLNHTNRGQLCFSNSQQTERLNLEHRQYQCPELYFLKGGQWTTYILIQ